MPLYEAVCRDCGTEIEYRSSVQNAYSPPCCPNCRGATKKVVRTAPRGFVKGKFEPFLSPVDGSLIRTERALREHNARNGVVNIHDGHDEATVLAGDFGRSAPVQSKPDIKKDIYQACQKLEQGYKPVIGVLEDE